MEVVVAAETTADVAFETDCEVVVVAAVDVAFSCAVACERWAADEFVGFAGSLPFEAALTGGTEEMPVPEIVRFVLFALLMLVFVVVAAVVADDVDATVASTGEEFGWQAFVGVVVVWGVMMM
jgi:hypothetical protein